RKRSSLKGNHDFKEGRKFVLSDLSSNRINNQGESLKSPSLQLSVNTRRGETGEEHWCDGGVVVGKERACSSGKGGNGGKDLLLQIERRIVVQDGDETLENFREIR